MTDYEKQQMAREFDAVCFIITVASDAKYTNVIGKCLREDLAVADSCEIGLLSERLICEATEAREGSDA